MSACHRSIVDDAGRTCVGSDVILDSPCWVDTVKPVDGDRVVLRLVEDVNLVGIPKEHLRISLIPTEETPIPAVDQGGETETWMCVRLTICAETPASPTDSKASGAMREVESLLSNQCGELPSGAGMAIADVVARASAAARARL